MPPLQITVEFIVAASLVLVLLAALIRNWWRARSQRQRFAKPDHTVQDFGKITGRFGNTDAIHGQDSGSQWGTGTL